MEAQKKYLECINNKSSKFYELEISFDSVITKHGKIGGKTIVHIYHVYDLENNLVLKKYNSLLKDKLKKGYKEVPEPARPIMQLIEFEEFYYYNNDLFCLKELEKFKEFNW